MMDIALEGEGKPSLDGGPRRAGRGGGSPAGIAIQGHHFNDHHSPIMTMSWPQQTRVPPPASKTLTLLPQISQRYVSSTFVIR